MELEVAHRNLSRMVNRTSQKGGETKKSLEASQRRSEWMKLLSCYSAPGECSYAVYGVWRAVYI